MNPVTIHDLIELYDFLKSLKDPDEDAIDAKEIIKNALLQVALNVKTSYSKEKPQ